MTHCCCGKEIELEDGDTWVHADDGVAWCYPESTDPEESTWTAEPEPNF